MERDRARSEVGLQHHEDNPRERRQERYGAPELPAPGDGRVGAVVEGARLRARYRHRPKLALERSHPRHEGDTGDREENEGPENPGGPEDREVAQNGRGDAADQDEED